MFTKIIELLLQEKASLDEEMALDIEVVVNEIKAKYAERSDKIGAMLSLAGYVEPVDEELDEIDAADPAPVEETVGETVEEAAEARSGETFYSI